MPNEIYKMVDDYLNHLKINGGNGSIHALGHTYSTMTIHAKDLMKQYNLISFRSFDESASIVDITSFGLQVLESGGIGKYIESLNQKLYEKELLQATKLKYETLNEKRIFKTYWWTFGMALIALALSLYSFIASFFK